MYEKLGQEEEQQIKKDFISVKLKVAMVMVGTLIFLILFFSMSNKIHNLEEWNVEN